MIITVFIAASSIEDFRSLSGLEGSQAWLAYELFYYLDVPNGVTIEFVDIVEEAGQIIMESDLFTLTSEE